MMELEFFASCLPGLEQALAQELKSFGIERVRPLGGGAAFFCEADAALRACLWSRLASRVMLVVGRVNAGDAELLYAGVYDIAWEDVLADGATMAVRAHGSNDELRNTRFTALKVKDAIADRMRAKRGARPEVDTLAPRASVDVRIRDRRATVSLDFSGEALNRRAYLASDDKEDAALACSLAAGALALGGWDELVRKGAFFVDPACSDGIVLVEAALVACDAAPGLLRKKWGFQGWAFYDEGAWQKLHAEACERFASGLARLGATPPDCITQAELLKQPLPDPDRIHFLGTATSSPMITRARNHVRHAGLRSVVSVELAGAADIAQVISEHKALGHAHVQMVASNLDAISRADALALVQADEAAFAAAAALAREGSRFVAVGAQDMASRFGAEPVLRQIIGRGRVEVPVEVFDMRPAGVQSIQIPDLAGGAPHVVEVFEAASEQFAARLRKMFKERRKWAQREGVSCFRIYDADLPDYAVAIDWYTGAGDARGNDYLHIAEYAPPASVDADKARRRFKDVLSIAPIVCGVRPDHVFSKTRVREKGGGQYRNAGGRAYVTSMEEGGCLFEVDLAGRLDTGIFLDHRLTRELVRSKAAGARFLNLFAYTGTASVYAAAGGAKSTTTVDLSQNYLDWARRNMAANGFSGEAHEFVKSDVMRWITETRRTNRRFELVFVDPPTFSNSKSMGKRTWDVQRDHVELLIGVSRLLAREGGEAIFSCNLRSFKPNVDELAKYGVAIEDISEQTIPEDFARNPKIHKCYLVRRA
ncbi:MAG: bifunctional 23S rRNA (guanine(2069)-N(7))-methyltransferase RlmK/23S rRNA (guanine(2445)-N(2))-methyltransferase RlmL [Eggerthellaceae bacterium]|nr:bifunctional 23S rRNA (guanine(2069)-N(7))-methyltransferase RlmK/23S rRNA (guanine(2445)-N(2))-methyltransferase RlmL [Eggerthellaceae bacterium]